MDSSRETPLEADERAELLRMIVLLAKDSTRLRAERNEGRRIARWMYDRTPVVRLTLGDVSEWPWLLEDEAEVDQLPLLE